MTVRGLFALFCASSLAACAATPEPGPVQQEAAALADLLVRTAGAEPDRIDAARPQMAALRAALTAPAPEDVAVSDPDRETRPVAAPPAAPDLTGARSVMSAAHLASYRLQDNAAPGWRELQERFPDALSGLTARLATVDLGDRGVYLRLKAGPLDSPEAANALCARLEAAGSWCATDDFSGEPLTPGE